VSRKRLSFIAFLFVVFTGPGIAWLIWRQSLGVVSVVALVVLAFIGLSLIAINQPHSFWPWAIGMMSLLLAPALLVLGGALGGKARPALYNWIYLYGAGAVGGLILELIVGRGRLELPWEELAPSLPEEPLNPTNPPGPPDDNIQHAAAIIDGTEKHSDEEEGTPESESEATDITEDAFAPYGARYDIGFFARLTLGGVAAAAFLVLLRAASSDLRVHSLSQYSKRLDTMALAALIGAVSITVWKAAQAIVNARLAPLLTTLENATDNVSEAHQSLSAATTTPERGLEAVEGLVRRLQSPHLHASLAVENRSEAISYLMDREVEVIGPTIGGSLERARQQSMEREKALARSLGRLDAALSTLRGRQHRVRRIARIRR
jgi:hypothetical protein